MKAWRWLLAVAWLAGAGLVQAQPATDAHAQRAEEEALRRVWLYLEDKDCSGAVKMLNDGLAQRVPAMWLLAGAMYEDGLCLKASRDKAIQMFQRAHEMGQRAGLHRLVAGLAAPGPGQDKAAALWWALAPERPNLPEPCAAGRPYRADPDRFVAVLRAWPAARLEACVYTAAVMGAMAGEMEFPTSAAAYGLSARLEVVFQPAAGTIDVRTEEVEDRRLGGLRSGDFLRDGASRTMRDTFERHVRQLAARTLQRFARPDGIDPTWRLSTRWTFDYVR